MTRRNIRYFFAKKHELCTNCVSKNYTPGFYSDIVLKICFFYSLSIFLSSISLVMFRPYSFSFFWYFQKIMVKHDFLHVVNNTGLPQKLSKKILICDTFFKIGKTIKIMVSGNSTESWQHTNLRTQTGRHF